jgi:putative phosphoesterase
MRRVLAGSAESVRIERRRRFPAPLLIGVVSDTHLYRQNPGKALPLVVELFKRFKVDLILHAGDVNAIPALETLSLAAPVMAVQGNNDDAAVMEVAPEEIEFEVGCFRFALLHGHGGGVPARAEAKIRFAGKVDCVIYGHSHIPMIEKVQGTIFFNPGSAEQRRWHPHFGIGLITVSEDRIDPELILWDRHEDLASVNPEPDRTPSDGRSGI